MKNIKNLLLYVALFLFGLGKVSGQTFPVNAQSSFDAQADEGGISIDNLGGNVYTFDPTDFLIDYDLFNGVEYNCLWSFGDGQYSTEFSPTHTYPVFDEVRDYQVVLYATPIHSPIDPPPAVYLPSSDFITVQSGTVTNPVYNDNHHISLSYNRLPRASYESTFILTYRNVTSSPAAFPVDFYFNDDFFELEGVNAPGQETYIDDPTTNQGNIYNRKLTFQSPTLLAPDEERTIFIQLTTKAAAIGGLEIDPHGEIVIIESPLLFAEAESNLGTGSIYTDNVGMQAVGSWDPNNKISSVQYINRDGSQIPGIIRYRINFENVGTGPTSNVKIEDIVSPLLNISTFNYVDDKNKHSNLTITQMGNVITYDFNNLVLEGTNSSDNVNIDDCRYWFEVEFELDQTAFENTYGSSVRCISSGSIGTFGEVANIYFDNHEPITTNSGDTEVFCKNFNENPSIKIAEISPNPTTGYVSITYEVISVLDLTGASFTLVNLNTGSSNIIANQPVLDGSIGAHTFTLDLSNENPGNYMIVIQKSNLIFETSTIIKL